MRILFANHTSAWSGGEVSLMRLLQGLRADHDVCVACPPAGALADAVDRAGVDRLPLPTVDASLRLHPIQTPVGLAQLGSGGLALARVARRFRADVIHANSTRVGIMASIAKARGGPPYVVRAHEHVPATPVGRAVRGLIVRTAGGVAAVSDYTAARFNEGLPRPVATRVYNSIDHSRFNPAVQPAPLREQLGLSPGAALLGQVAQITPWKGQDVAIRTLAGVREAGVDAHLALAGQVIFGGKGVRYDNHAFRRSLEGLTGELGVRNAVHFLGQRGDVPELLRALDVSLVPSWEEPFGLVTVESLAVGTPPLVSAVGAGPELVQDGVTGRTLPPRLADPWIGAALELIQDREALGRMGERGPGAASGFRDDVHAGEMLAVYKRALGGAPRDLESRGAVRAGTRPESKAEAPWPG
jgi:glycosyltransferase involved in cell wall biosynthesis